MTSNLSLRVSDVETVLSSVASMNQWSIYQISRGYEISLSDILQNKMRSLSSHLPPVHTDGQEGEHVEGDRHVGDVVVDSAVNGTKDPNSANKRYFP